MRFFRFFLLTLLCLPAFTDENEVSQLHPEIANHEGWNFRLLFGLDNPNFNFSRFVPAIDNATLIHLGGHANLSLNYLAGQHEWRNKLVLSIGYNLDQFVSDFVKARDYLNLDSIYYFSFGESRFWGLFGQLLVDTSMLPGVDIQPAESPTTYNVFDAAGNQISSTTATRLTLTGAFSPMILTENIGLFIRPTTWPFFSWEIKGGMYFNQGLIAGKLVIADVDDTVDPTVTTVETLENFFQVGAVLGNSIWGAMGRHFNYTASIYANYAFFDKGSVVDLPNSFANNISMNAAVGLRYQPLSWLGVTWEGHAKYQPYITSEFQLDSFINFNFSYSIM